MNVIIVDDEKPARDLVRSFLSQHDEFVIIDEADNGFDGCLKINKHKPDLVFLDFQLHMISLRCRLSKKMQLIIY